MQSDQPPKGFKILKSLNSKATNLLGRASNKLHVVICAITVRQEIENYCIPINPKPTKLC